MRKLALLGAVTGSILAAGASFAQISGGHVQAGTLTCDISGGIGFIIGSQKALNCSFVPVFPAPPEFYSGMITKLGIDLGGTRSGVMVWAVYAPTSRTAGFLAGTYGGASAEVTVGAGVGATSWSAARPARSSCSRSRFSSRPASTSRPVSPKLSCASCADPSSAIADRRPPALIRTMRSPSAAA
jgi:uncharacterized protein DUF992